MAPVLQHPRAASSGQSIHWDIDTVRDHDGRIWLRNGDGTSWRTADGRHETTGRDLATGENLTDMTGRVDWSLGTGGAA